MTAKTPICKMLGIDFPLLAPSHCRDVVAGVSRAGGFGVLGATGFTIDQLELELKWIDDHIDGQLYGIDVLIPENLSIRYDQGVTMRSLVEHIPQQHKDFVRDILSLHGIEPSQAIEEGRVRSPDAPVPFQPEYALKLLELAFHHPIRLIANTLGVPPQAMIDMGHRHGVPVAALVGAPNTRCAR